MSADAHEAAFLADVVAHPGDDTPRLVFADWLEDRGLPADLDRAAFVRGQFADAELWATVQPSPHTCGDDPLTPCLVCVAVAAIRLTRPALTDRLVRHAPAWVQGLPLGPQAAASALPDSLLHSYPPDVIPVSFTLRPRSRGIAYVLCFRKGFAEGLNLPQLERWGTLGRRAVTALPLTGVCFGDCLPQADPPDDGDPAQRRHFWVRQTDYEALGWAGPGLRLPEQLPEALFGRLTAGRLLSGDTPGEPAGVRLYEGEHGRAQALADLSAAALAQAREDARRFAAPPASL